jgi:leucyl-tRNA synthetase
MSEKYNHQAIEKKWQKIWDKEQSWHVSENLSLPKQYILDMFPYPSAEGLHVGHPEGYTATDILARYLRLKGFNVLHPMGWDAFGLPAENYAIKTGTHPKTITVSNIKNFKQQIKSLGFSYDWTREINTTDPGYYRWTQWIFLQLFKKGLAYEAIVPINWCPKDKTGLANEEVVGGKCERCGTLVVKKDVRQWMLRITNYADRLLTGLDKLDWPEPIKLLQRNWIGRSEGAVIHFKVQISKIKSIEIDVFTTRADTLFGATYLVVAPEHPLVQSSLGVVKNRSAVEKYIQQASGKSDLERTSLEKDKTGVELKGLSAINPATGKKIPVWVSDYVLISYGTGAIMAVPAHDERDFTFATKYKLPIIKVIEPPKVMSQSKLESVASSAAYGHLQGDLESPCWTGEGTMINSEQYNRLSSIEGGKRIIAWLEKNNLGKKSVNYKLRDWVFSRQRYWGEPIPLIHCTTCKNEVTTTKYYLSFYNQEAWNFLVSGVKTVETRALNPEEQDRFFGRIKKGDYIKCINRMTSETMYLEVMESQTFKNLVSFYGRTDMVNGLRDKGFKSVEELQEYYRKLAPAYEKKIEKNGLIAWRIRAVMPGIIPVAEDKLPVKLPEVKKYEPTGTGESPLALIENWVKVKCPRCKGEARRETNTMPQWAGSCWYYLRYLDPDNKNELVDKEKEKYWMGDKGVDVYVGGAEHAVLHLMYARFWHMFLYDLGVVSTPEPFNSLKNQGMILGEDGQKMSKSRGNVINPDEVIEEFGADSMRLYEMFMGPFETVKPWSKQGIRGVYRFLQRVWDLQERVKEISVPEPLEKLRHKLIKKITNDIETYNFNTAVSTFMETINQLATYDTIPKVFWRTFLVLLKPFAPHMAEELWERLGHEQSMTAEKWPTYNEQLLLETEIQIIVQVNGTLRDRLVVPVGSDDEVVKKVALTSNKVKKYVVGQPKKVIVVKDKLINFVI